MAPFKYQSEPSWQACLTDLFFVCASASPAQSAVLVRAAHALLAAAPGSWRAHWPDLVPLETIEAQLAAGAETGAALALLEGRASYILSCGPATSHMATVVFEGLTEEASATGETAALALIGALAGTLAGPGLQLAGEPGLGVAASSLRLN